MSETDEQTIARLREDLADTYQVNGRMGQLLSGVANGLYGDPGPLMMRDWSGLPKAVREIRQIVLEGLAAVDAAKTDVVETDAFKSTIQTLAKHLELLP